MKGYIYKKKSLKMTSLYIVFDAGSRLETEGRYGTMHLMEHLVCKTFKDMYDKLSKLGITWNAYTTEECVIMYFKGLDKYLTNKLKQELYERITGGIDCVTENVFENERNVVIQEYLDCEFNTVDASWMRMSRKWYGDYSAIGRRGNIENFSYRDMLDTYEKHFRKPARIVEVGRKRTDFFKTIQCCQIEKNKKLYRFGLRKDFEDIQIASDNKVPVFVFSKKRVNPRDYPFLSIGLDMLTCGLESPFYAELREKLGLTYYVYGNIHTAIDNGYLYITACTDTENVKQLKDRLTELTKNVESYLTLERYETIISMTRIERETKNELLYDNPVRLIDISKLKLPKNLEKLTYEKVVETTVKYLKKSAVLDIND